MKILSYLIVIALAYPYYLVCDVAAQEQARQYMELRESGFIETHSGALLEI